MWHERTSCFCARALLKTHTTKLLLLPPVISIHFHPVPHWNNSSIVHLLVKAKIKYIPVLYIVNVVVVVLVFLSIAYQLNIPCIVICTHHIHHRSVSHMCPVHTAAKVLHSILNVSFHMVNTHYHYDLSADKLNVYMCFGYGLLTFHTNDVMEWHFFKRSKYKIYETNG